jgi:hypothetical protein
VFGVIEGEAIEDKELPTEFMATTVNVRADPFVKPVIVVDSTLPMMFTGLPTEGVTVYPVIAEPPSETGAFHDTTANALPATAVTTVGEKGTVIGITEDEGEEDEELLPAEFIATTVNVTPVPLVRPLRLAVRTLPTVT